LATADSSVTGPFSDDEIFCFGFSRGAFTIRVLTGFVATQGLVSFDSESDLDRKAIAAYRAYRAARYHSKTGIENVFRWMRNLFVDVHHVANQRPVAKIRFLGLWDSVAAYGLPVDEMTRGPLELPDRILNEKIQRACHALALDDERTTFHPLLWDEQGINSADPPKPRYTHDERLSQVWFAGVHSNVRGRLSGRFTGAYSAYVDLIGGMPLRIGAEGRSSCRSGCPCVSRELSGQGRAFV
jgi:uncharacterized protein (DUF2235 family)